VILYFISNGGIYLPKVCFVNYGKNFVQLSCTSDPINEGKRNVTVFLDFFLFFFVFFVLLKYFVVVVVVVAHFNCFAQLIFAFYLP